MGVVMAGQGARIEYEAKDVSGSMPRAIKRTSDLLTATGDFVDEHESVT